MSISFPPILDFSLNCNSQWRNECFLEKKFFDLKKIEEDRVALARTQYTPQWL